MDKKTMKCLALLLLLVSLSLAENCGMEGRARGRRASGGRKTHPHQYPWMVHLQYMGDDGKPWHCGGSLISDRHILTADHCYYTAGENIANFWPAKIGVYNIYDQSDYEEFKIEKAFSTGSDMAIFRLEKTVDLTKPYIGKVCLPKTGNEVYTGKKVKALGWGDVHPTEKWSPRLKEVDLEVAESDVTWLLKTNVTKVNGVYQDPCPGDSGGPILYQEKDKRWTIIGTIESGGYDCKEKKDDKIKYLQWSTKVTYDLKWIKCVIREDTTNNAKACDE